ncbi:Arrestin domain-containing protein 4 [Orchesella cincta]|uniref:Arrestin domain-containing protein 4 n=1 Tax=Orchesella cincta TaxID=48709 RepID=A0A1D2MRF2_ORCCI|nr:Arrestin domain-containing protein 4 [Orchesella cincta]
MSRKLLKFLILFDNPSLLYFPGQFLTGRVLVELEDDTPVLGLYLHILGEGCVRLKSRGQERVYDKENYIDFRMRLLGESSQGPIILSPGIHSFPFKLGLPLGLPSTFLGKHGWIQYFCKAALKEPNGLVHKNQQVFIVMSPIDLNLEPPVVAQPFHCEMEHKLGMPCASSGTVKCRLRLGKGGYIPGEKIHIWASVTNNSRVEIKATEAILTETIQYTARGKVVQTERRELTTLSRGKIKSGHKDEWINEKLVVPPLPPTNLRGCNLIRIQYELFFIVIPKSFNKKIKLQVPILIATYPLRGENNTNTGSLSRSGSKERYPTILPTYRPTSESKSVK